MKKHEIKIGKAGYKLALKASRQFIQELEDKTNGFLCDIYEEFLPEDEEEDKAAEEAFAVEILDLLDEMKYILTLLLEDETAFNSFLKAQIKQESGAGRPM